MSKIALELEINPFLNTQEFNRIIGALKSSLGENVKIKPIDESAFKSATKEAEKFKDETKEANENVKDLEETFDDIPKSVKNVVKEIEKTPTLFDSIKNGITGAFDFSFIKNFAVAGIITDGLGKVTEGIGFLAEQASKSDAIGTAMENGFRLAGLSGEALANQLSETTDFARELGLQLGVAPERLKELSATAGALGGATGKMNKDLTKLALGVENATGGMIKGEAAIKIFSRGIADPENAEAIDKLKKQFPQLGEALLTANTPSEKLKAGLEALSGTFKTMENDTADVEARFGIFKLAIAEGAQAVGGAFLGAFNTDRLFNFFSELGNGQDTFKILENAGTALGNSMTNALNVVIDGFELVSSSPVFKFLADNLELVGVGIGTYLLYQKAMTLEITYAEIKTKGLALAQGTYNTIVGIGSSITGAYTALTSAMSSGTVIATAKTWLFNAAQTALNLVMSINPIGAVVLAIGALTAGLVYAYKNSEGFRKFIDGLWSIFKGWLNTLGTIVKKVLEFFGILGKEKPKAIKETNEELDKTKNKIEENTKVEIQNKKVTDEKKKSTETIYQIEKARFDLLNKNNQRSIELQKIELETQRAKENTTLTIEDELLLNNLILNEQKRQLQQAEKLLAVKKKDNKETEEAKNIYEDLKKSIATTELNDIKIKAKLELEKTEIENLQKQLNRNTLETEIKLKLRNESDLIVDDIRNLNEIILGLENDLNKAKVGINTKAQAEINLKITEAQNQLRLKQIELEEKKETERLNSIISADEKIKETQLSNLNKNYGEQIKLVQSNDIERIKLELQFQKEKQKIEDEYLNKTKDKYEKSAEDLSNSFSSSLSNLTIGDYGLNTEAQAQARETLKSIEKEESELRKSYARRQIDKKEYYEKLSELDAKRKEQDDIIRDNQFNFWTGINKGISDALSEQRNIFLKYFTENLNDYKTYQTEIAEINKKQAEKELELANAKKVANLELEIKLTDEIKSLTDDKAKAVELSSEKMSKAYSDLGIATGLTFGKMLADGDNFKKAFVKSSLGALKALVPILVAEIIGKEFATKSVIGIATSALLSGLLYAGLSKAESAASAFRKGGAFGTLEQLRESGGGLIRGGERVERVRFNEEGEEYFINHKATKLNLKHLDNINKYNLRIEDYAVKLPEVQERIINNIKPIKNITYINNNIIDSKQINQLVAEVKELKELSRSNHRSVIVSNELDVKMKFNENRFIEDTNIKIRKNIRR